MEMAMATGDTSVKINNRPIYNVPVGDQQNSPQSLLRITSNFAAWFQGEIELYEKKIIFSLDINP